MKRFLSIGFFMFLSPFFSSAAPAPSKEPKCWNQSIPQWNKAMLMKVAERQVEPGMTEEMVIEAMGRKGEQRSTDEPGVYEWTYYTEVARGMSAYWAPAFWVYFKGGVVVRTTGDRFRIGYW